METIEFIESYKKVGNDYQWNDNHGELVRCKNCRWCYECSGGELRCEISYERNNMDRTVTEDWYCADGERGQG